MSITQVIVGMGFAAIATSVGEKIAGNLGQVDIANYIKVAGVSGTGLLAINLCIKLLNTVKNL